MYSITYVNKQNKIYDYIFICTGELTVVPEATAYGYVPFVFKLKEIKTLVNDNLTCLRTEPFNWLSIGRFFYISFFKLFYTKSYNIIL